MRTVRIKKREMDVSKLSNWIVEDTHDFDSILFEVDEELTDLYLYLLYVNPEGTGGVETLTGNVWIPSHSFTAVKGVVKIQLVATEDDAYSQTSDVRWSSIATTITLHENIEPSVPVVEPEQSVIENLICEELE